ncbi:hypothetical protein LIER_43962 [Lithospermum erythrorhizon]|uniref:Uncharacterized protein n=1 Tax=Lithospermum erythrorhizon TaxID=34254 RepID=A0AAV3RC30_LITER
MIRLWALTTDVDVVSQVCTGEEAATRVESCLVVEGICGGACFMVVEGCEGGWEKGCAWRFWTGGIVKGLKDRGLGAMSGWEGSSVES